jgi:hypothetical protein
MEGSVAEAWCEILYGRMQADLGGCHGEKLKLGNGLKPRTTRNTRNRDLNTKIGWERHAEKAEDSTEANQGNEGKNAPLSSFFVALCPYERGNAGIWVRFGAAEGQ